jgi:hypothetical protein
MRQPYLELTSSFAFCRVSKNKTLTCPPHRLHAAHVEFLQEPIPFVDLLCASCLCHLSLKNTRSMERLSILQNHSNFKDLEFLYSMDGSILDEHVWMRAGKQLYKDPNHYDTSWTRHVSTITGWCQVSQWCTGASVNDTTFSQSLGFKGHDFKAFLFLTRRKIVLRLWP